MMELKLTKAQVKTLLTIMYCGEWVLNSHKTQEDKLFKETSELEQYIFSQAIEVGFEKWIKYDEESGKYFPTLLMEEALDKHVSNYDKRTIRRSEM